MARVLIPLPDRDFDPTECAVPWHVLREAGHEIVFATEHGAIPACDPRLIEGVIFGELGAKPEPKRLYAAMASSKELNRPISWASMDVTRIDALVVPGGHAQGMKQLLDSATLRDKIGEYAATKKPLAAVCHGVLALARSTDPASGKSVLFGRHTTCLPKYMERIAYWLTAWKLGRYYRTYDAYVEDEVRSALERSSDFERGPITLVRHGTEVDPRGAFVVEDDNYVSARWPGDAYLFAEKIRQRLA